MSDIIEEISQPEERPIVGATPIADTTIAPAASKSTAKRKKSSTTKRSSTSKKRKRGSTWEPVRGINISWRKLLGLDKWSRKTGIPTSKAGVERKLGKWILDWLKGLFSSKK